ncbi:MAG: hypothetical protein QOI86_1332 [Actinomycetota bacterium]|jgi:hypothetical protein|nr:hypothetical protein [Actinomycetota bacterium]
MCLQAGPALGFDPPERVALNSPGDAIAWARTIPGFGWYAEIYALFLNPDRTLRRAAWLGSATALDDFVAWPDFSLGYTPPGGAEAVMLLVCRPGEGVEPTPDDTEVFALLGLAHDARGVPLLDVVLVDGGRWRSLAGG